MNLWSLIPLASSVVYGILLLTLLFQIKTQLNKIFTIFLFTATAWSVLAFLLSYDLSPSRGQLVFWNNLLLVVMVCSGFSYYHFVRVYTQQRAGIIVFAGYGAAIVIAILSLFGLVVRDAYMSDGRVYHEIGPWVYILTVLLLPPLAACAWILFKQLQKTQNPVEHNRIAYLIFGLAIMTLWAAINPNIPVLATLPTDHLGTLVNALLITLAIGQYDLLDIRLLARKALEYSILLLATLGVYAGLVYFEATVLSGLPTYVLLILSGLFSLFFAMLLRPIRFLVQERIDRMFHRDTYLHRQALIEFSSKIANKIKLDQIADDMLSTVGKALRLTRADLVLETEENGDFATVFSYPQSKKETVDSPKVDRHNPLLVWLNKESKPIITADIQPGSELHVLLNSDSTLLSDPRYALFFPIKSPERLIGILALGHKQAGNRFYPEEVGMISNVVNQASIVIENAQLYAQAKERANMDELTGLFNHRYFHQRIDEEIIRAARFGQVFSLLTIDLDFFKKYNDVYGHLYGDKILRVIANRIKESIRAIDLVFRYGGDEFVVMLPQASADNAVKVAERIHHSIDNEVDYKGMPVTCSIGIASWPTDGIMREEIVHASDAALYLAKQTGRNKVCMASEVEVSQKAFKEGVAETGGIVLNTIYALAATVDAKDHYTYGHSKKVSRYASDIAGALGYSEERKSVIRTAGLLHDIGKIGVSDKILGKRGSLTEEEWEPIRSHPDMGVSIIKNVDSLKDCLPAIQYHHERYDGSGYPTGLRGENIPLDARILAVADSYDAMTSQRPYREECRSVEDALSELINCSGTQFDPIVVRVFVKLMRPNMPTDNSSKTPDKTVTRI
jgi:diguanylate cyclase (GGDEF)-like protein/putative nucleotidyltransferase with HDIG domain